MPKFGKWILTLGLVAATPHAAFAANPFSKLFGSRDSSAKKTAGARSNQQVANEIAEALRAARLNRYKMDVAFARGVCTIKGQVADPREKARVTQIVSRIAGVRRVDNRLQVARQSTSPRSGIRQALHTQSRGGSAIQRVGFENSAQPSGASNQEVAENIGRALKTAGLTGYDMEIQYRNGIAMLSGSVSSSLHRSQAEEVVRGVPGVKIVNNRLRVEGQQGSAGPRISPAQHQLSPQQQMALRQQMAMQRMAMQQRAAGGYPVQQTANSQPVPPGAPGAGVPGYRIAPPTAPHAAYNNTNLPAHSWPTYASYPNYSQLTYPKQYSASAWPYIGPFYPYPQVPLGWRKATLEWDDGFWALDFHDRTDRWWWFLNPHNWSSRAW